jgi:DNA-nicking Smr family endonuclease
MRKTKGGLDDLKALYKAVQAEKTRQQTAPLASVQPASREQTAQRESDAKLFARATQAVVPIRTDQAKLLHKPGIKSPEALSAQRNKQARATGETSNSRVAAISPVSDGPALQGLDQGLSKRDSSNEPRATTVELVYASAGVGPDTTRRLRQAYWPVGAALDLHGMTKDQARRALTEFIAQSHQFRTRCVRIIHGVGHGSAQGQPVLRNLVAHWLTQLSSVQAYATAPKAHGGHGALLVLIRLA